MLLGNSTIDDISREAMRRQEYFFKQSELYKAGQEAKKLSTEYLKGYIGCSEASKGLVRRVLGLMKIVTKSERIRAYESELKNRPLTYQ